MYDVNIDIIDDVLVRIKYLAANAEDPIHFASNTFARLSP
jgi:hypothetical protein